MKRKYTIINGELYHYGVPGMKWGVVKDEQPRIVSTRDKKIPTLSSGGIRQKTHIPTVAKGEPHTDSVKRKQRIKEMEAYRDEVYQKNLDKYDVASAFASGSKDAYAKAYEAGEATSEAMREKFGKDYDMLIRRDTNREIAKTVGVAAIGVALTALASFAVSKISGSSSARVGRDRVGRMGIEYTIRDAS